MVLQPLQQCFGHTNHIAIRKAKIVCNFGLSVCNRVKLMDSDNAWLLVVSCIVKNCCLQ